MVGNAVPVNLSYAMATQILKYLIIRCGDAFEVKKISTNTSNIVLNSSFSKDKITNSIQELGIS